MCFRIFTDDFDYNLRFLILDAPGPAGMMKWAARRKRIPCLLYGKYRTTIAVNTVAIASYRWHPGPVPGPVIVSEIERDTLRESIRRVVGQIPRFTTDPGSSLVQPKIWVPRYSGYAAGWPRRVNTALYSTSTVLVPYSYPAE